MIFNKTVVPWILLKLLQKKQYENSHQCTKKKPSKCLTGSLIVVKVNYIA